MDPFSIGALVAAVAGAGLQYKAATDAQERQRRVINEGLERQRQLQLKAEKTALDAAGEYEVPKRTEAQQQIEEELTEQFIAPVSESQAVRSAQQETQGEVSSDYKASKQAADLETVKQAETLARLLGKSTSAGRLRLNEGINLMDARQAVNQLHASSQGQQQATDIGAQLAGQVSPGMSFLGSLLQTGGTAYLGANGLGLGGGNAAQGLSATGATSTGMGTGLGFKAGGGQGLKLPNSVAGWF